MRMAAQYEMLTQLAKAGTKLDFGQDLFVKFYQAFIASNRWQQYLKGVIPTLYVTAIALAIGVVLGSVVALVRVAHDQQRRGHHNPALAVANAVCKLYATVIRGTPMMVQMLIMSRSSLPTAATLPWSARWHWALTPVRMFRRSSAAV